VLYPVFTRLQDDLARLASVWLRVVRMVAAVAVPAMFGLVVLAPEFVSVVFGPRWHDAVPVMRILAWVGILFVLQGLNSVVLQALGRTRLLFLYAVASFVGGLGSFVLGLRWGIVGVAACFAVVSTVMQPLYMHLTAKSLGIGIRECVGVLTGVLQASVLVVAAVLATRHLLIGGGASPGLTVALSALVGALVYVPACAWRAPEVIRDLVALRGRRATAA
jgi:PST family polysaccharide transporter